MSHDNVIVNLKSNVCFSASAAECHNCSFYIRDMENGTFSWSGDLDCGNSNPPAPVPTTRCDGQCYVSIRADHTGSTGCSSDCR